MSGSRQLWHWIILGLAWLSAYACTSPAGTASSSPESYRPDWVRNRPISGMYYVGIGVAQKSRDFQYQNVARENALSDLAAEIRVNVSSNSLLYTLEREYKFEQEFRETVRISTDLELEDFDLVDTWEDEHSYWVYYRLNKADYAEQQARRRRAAQSLALDFYAKGLAAENSGHFSNAADSYLRGLQALELFWGEDNEVDFQGEKLRVDNRLFTHLRDLLSTANVLIENELVLNFQNGFQSTAQVLVTRSERGLPLEAVPLSYEYFGSFGRVLGKVNTNADGRAEIPLSNADRERSGNTLVCAIDTEHLFEPFRNDRFMRTLTSSLRSRSANKAIRYSPPRVYIDSREQNLGRDMASTPLTSAVKTSLGRRGMSFATSESDADLLMRIRSNTTPLGEDRGFFSTRLELDISIRNLSNGESVYSVSRSNIRGVDLDHERAGLKAYDNLTRNIESELMRRLINDIL